MTTLGDRIKTLRGDKPQRWLAEQLSIPQTTLSNYEKNKSELNFALIDLITSIFCVNTDWLIFGRGPMRPGETPQPKEKTQQKTVLTAETLACARCTKLETKLEAVEQERRELSAENRKLWQENGELKALCATLTERQKICCPEPLPLFKKPPDGEGPMNSAQTCA